MSDIKANLTQISKDILGNHKLDNKSLQYWEQCIVNNLSTFDDFKNNIYASQAFMNVTKDMYDQLAFDLSVGQSNFTDFFKMYHGEDANIVNARNYITSLPEFSKKYRENISNILIYENGSAESITEDMIDFYFKKFVTIHDYSFDKMTLDIANNVHKGEQVVEFEKVEENLSSFKDDLTTSNLYNKQFVMDFEEVFQRPIFVQEYFKYNNILSINFQQLFKEHNENYNRLREIFESYTGKTISEYFYVHKFLDFVDDPQFFEKIVNDIVGSNEYKNSMQRILVEQYKSMYDIDLDEQDINYIFDIVKRQKLDIKNEKIAIILSDLKEETDSIVSNIFKEFTRVLERPPDVYDIEQYTNYYRSKLDEGYKNINKNLENILMHTLEFHDIIKKKIKELYVSKYGNEIKPSILFDCLNRVLTKNDEFDMDSMDQLIGKFL